ncbi:MAG TPA: ATP-binding protein [Candidatus Saccharimonadales bacterium]|nr:ATP-binding protein [Candidatus Saccharimonadales bacterium]
MTEILEIILYFLSLGGVIIILGLVAIKGIRSNLNQAFLLFGFCVFVAVGLSNIAEFSHSATETIWLIRAALIFGDILCASFYRFTLAFTGWKPRLPWFPKATYITAPILAILTLFPITMKSVEILNPSGFVTNYGPLLWINLLYIMAIFTTCFVVLLFHSRQSENKVKLQVRIMIYGIGGALSVILFAQVVLPEFHFYSLRSIVSAPAGLIFTSAMALAVFRQKMFDIRSALLRSIGYALTVSIVIGLYVLIILGLGKLLLPNHELNGSLEAYLIIPAVILAFSFRPLTRGIEKATSKIFFRDRLDPEDLLNKVGRILASEIRLEVLGRQVVNMLNQNIHTVADIIILDNGHIFFESQNYFGADLPAFENDLALLGQNILVVDDLPESEQKKVMLRRSISVFVVLKAQEEVVGYLILGYKTSGASYTKHEIALIQTIADELAVGVQNSRSYTQIQQFSESLQAKVDEATEQLRAANEKLKEDDAAKNDFISMASHQLGTPLSVIDGYLTLANQGAYGKITKKLSGPLKMAKERASVMRSLLTDLLDISRMTAGKFVLEIAPANFKELVTKEVDNLQNLANTQKSELVFHEPNKTVPTVNIDAQKTGQAVMNLINNALQYTPEGNVDVYLDADDQYITFKVVDNGIGVPQEQQQKLFSKFFRADNARKHRPSGTGIGLYLVKRVVEDQGGSLIFSSEINKGSTFGFRLPINRPNVTQTTPLLPAQS